MEDEQYDRIPDESFLRERWESFTNDEKYAVFLFVSEGLTAGYAVVHIDEDPMYLRHFYICREFRRKGIGTGAFRCSDGGPWHWSN